jgi:two-component system invasion response regulator UvrY
LITTVLADDHKLFCDGLERVLNDSGHFHVVQKFYNGQTLLEKINVHNPDLLIIDVEMPTINGFDAIKRIRLNNTSSKIVVLSMHEENVFSQEAFMLGADAYLNKSMESMQLIDSLLKTVGGQKIFPQASTTSKIESPFSDREHEILRLIASGKTSEQIAERLKISHLTVKAHRRNMMRKLNVNNAAELISRALEMGFLYGLT